jgi:pimeloyl-ACP methyl ester carboxylesterase
MALPEVSVVTRAYAAGRHGQIHYRRAGPDEAVRPVLLLHVMPISGYVYEPFMGEMGRERTTVAPDLPGYGMSDRPSTQPEIADYAAAMLEFAAGLGWEAFDVIGYHTGGAIAVDMARLRPERVRRIVMISAPITWRGEELAAKRAAYVPKTTFEHADALPGIWRMLCEDKRWGMEPEARRWNMFLERARHLDVPSWGHRAMDNYHLPDILPAIETPVLVLNPEDDVWKVTPRVAPYLRNGRVLDLPGWSLGFLTAKAAETAAIVCDFLDGPG